MSQHFTLTGAVPRMDLKQLSAQWLESNIRGPHALSSEETPAVPYYPFRWLPALQYFDTLSRMREGICILKGSIVSSLHMLTAQNINAINGNQAPWSTNQAWALFTPADGGAVQPITLENSINAYGSDVHSLLVPANGGTQADLEMTALDVSMGRLRPDGTAVAAGDTITLPANIPIGLVMDDIYVDYRGQFLNYQPEGKLLTNVYKQMEVVYPYVDVAAFDGNYANAGKEWLTPVTGAKLAVDPFFRYFYFDAAATTANGMKVVSDLAGNPYCPTAPITDPYQIVGALDGLNPKQPHSLNDLHDSMLGSGMTGTDTAGVEAELFWFVWAAILAGGVYTPTNPGNTLNRQLVLNAIRAGQFGWATLWINVR